MKKAEDLQSSARFKSQAQRPHPRANVPNPLDNLSTKTFQVNRQICNFFWRAKVTRGCIFIDGENLRHSICDLFTGIFSRNDYLPKLADWSGWFDWLIDQTCGPARRVRAYWYVVEHLDFYPYPPFPKDEARCERILRKHSPNRPILDALSGSEKSARINELMNDLNLHHSRMRNRFDGWRKVQDGIVSKHDAVEFRRAGAIRYDLFTGRFGDEKSVDVKLATDLIVLRDIYDVAVIVSGDQDYVPAVQSVKDSGLPFTKPLFAHETENAMVRSWERKP